MSFRQVDPFVHYPVNASSLLSTISGLDGNFLKCKLLSCVKIVYHRTPHDVAISRPLNLIEYPLGRLVRVSEIFSLALLINSYSLKWTWLR